MSPQYSSLLLSIIAVFNNDVIWMVSILLLISSSSSFFLDFLKLCSDNELHKCHIHISQIRQLSSKVVISIISHSFRLNSLVCQNSEIHKCGSLSHLYFHKVNICCFPMVKHYFILWHCLGHYQND